MYFCHRWKDFEKSEREKERGREREREENVYCPGCFTNYAQKLKTTLIQ